MLTRKPSASAAAGAAYPAGKEGAAAIATAPGCGLLATALGRAVRRRGGKEGGGQKAWPPRGCPRSCRRSGAVRVGTMIHPPPPPATEPGGPARGCALGSGVLLLCGVASSPPRGGGGGSRGGGGRKRNHLEERPRKNLESLRVPERPPLTGGSGARLPFPLRTCELLAGPRRRRDFSGPDGSGGVGRPSSPEACAGQSRLVPPVRRLPLAG